MKRKYSCKVQALQTCTKAQYLSNCEGFPEQCEEEKVVCVGDCRFKLSPFIGFTAVCSCSHFFFFFISEQLLWIHWGQKAQRRRNCSSREKVWDPDAALPEIRRRRPSHAGLSSSVFSLNFVRLCFQLINLAAWSSALRLCWRWRPQTRRGRSCTVCSSTRWTQSTAEILWS